MRGRGRPERDSGKVLGISALSDDRRQRLHIFHDIFLLHFLHLSGQLIDFKMADITSSQRPLRVRVRSLQPLVATL